MSNINLKNKKILVTGRAGFLGKFVVNKLLARGVDKARTKLNWQPKTK